MIFPFGQTFWEVQVRAKYIKWYMIVTLSIGKSDGLENLPTSGLQLALESIEHVYGDIVSRSFRIHLVKHSFEIIWRIGDTGAKVFE